MLFQCLNPMLLDSAASSALAKVSNEDNALDTAALNHQVQSLRKNALAVALTLADNIVSNDLDEDELPSDRLGALLAGFSTHDHEDELDIDDSTLAIITANVQDAFASFGVSYELIQAAFDDDVEEADQAIQAIAEIVESAVPTDEDDLSEFIQEFVFGADGNEIDDDGALYDAAVMGKTTVKAGKFGKVIYKAVKAVKNGKIVVKNMRVGGKVRLSPKQKQALAKARMKAHSSSSVKKRMRSLAKGKRAGLY